MYENTRFQGLTRTAPFMNPFTCYSGLTPIKKIFLCSCISLLAIVSLVYLVNSTEDMPAKIESSDIEVGKSAANVKSNAVIRAMPITENNYATVAAQNNQQEYFAKLLAVSEEEFNQSLLYVSRNLHKDRAYEILLFNMMRAEPLSLEKLDRIQKFTAGTAQSSALATITRELYTKGDIDYYRKFLEVFPLGTAYNGAAKYFIQLSWSKRNNIEDFIADYEYVALNSRLSTGLIENLMDEASTEKLKQVKEAASNSQLPANVKEKILNFSASK